jgi:hypothetical protein
MTKEKGIEICRNLNKTISNMSNKIKVESDRKIFKSCTAKKKDLLKIKEDLMTKYNIKNTEIK